MENESMPVMNNKKAEKEVSKEVLPIFNKYWNMSEEEFSKEEKNLTQNKIQRMFEISYDDAIDKKMGEITKQKELIKDNFKSFYLNSYRQSEKQIELLEKTMKEIEQLHVKFFGICIRNKR